MNSSINQARIRGARARRAASALAVLVAVTGLSAAGLSAGGPAAADPATPAVALVATTSSQTVERYKGEPVALYDLGLYLQAQQAKVEFRVKRPSYTVPVAATLTLGEGASAVTTPVPASVFTFHGVVDINTLPNFFSYTVNNSAGKLVKTGRLDFCPNSYAAARSVRDAPTFSPYPNQCGQQPFAIGDVLGIQRGWSVPALNDYSNIPSFSGPDGTYTLVMKINKSWQKLFGLSDAQSQNSIKLKVKSVTDSGYKGGTATGSGSSTAGMEQMAGMSGMTAADLAALSPQRARIHAAQMKALGKPHLANQAAPAGKLAKDVPATGPMPDLRTLPAYQIQLDPQTVTVKKKKVKKTYLDFGATVWNGGTSPLVVDGFRRPGTDLMDAYQYFYDTAGNETGSTPAGTLQWDGRAGHNHWHFTAFATYRLLDATQTVTMRSGKEAFCLAPTDPIDLTLPAANLKPYSTDLYTACGQGDEGALSIREVLDDGWGDTYSQYLPGQSFDVTSVPNGTYYIEVLANPDQKLTESNTTNNRSLRKLKIGGKVGGKRTIKVYDYKGIKVQ